MGDRRYPPHYHYPTSIFKIGRLTKRVVLDGTLVAGSNAKFEGTFDAYDATFLGLNVEGGNFNNINITNSTFSDGTIIDTDIIDSNLINPILTNPVLIDAIFQGTTIFQGPVQFLQDVTMVGDLTVQGILNLFNDLDMHNFNILNVNSLQFTGGATLQDDGAGGLILPHVTFTTYSDFIKTFPGRVVTTSSDPIVGGGLFMGFTFNYADKWFMIRSGSAYDVSGADNDNNFVIPDFFNVGIGQGFMIPPQRVTNQVAVKYENSIISSTSFVIQYNSLAALLPSNLMTISGTYQEDKYVEVVEGWIFFYTTLMTV